MSQGFRISEIVDSDKFNTRIINGRPQHVAPDAAKAIDANFNSHVSIPPGREPEFDADKGQQVQKTARQYAKQFRLADRETGRKWTRTIAWGKMPTSSGRLVTGHDFQSFRASI